MKLSYTIKKEDNFENLKELIKTQFQISDRLFLKLKKNNKIYLNNSNTCLWKPLEINDLVEIFIDFEEDNSNIPSTKMNLDIIYEDDAFLVINKPAGIPVHPSMQHYSDSLSSGVKYYFDTLSLHKKIRPVNRIDRNTGGIVIGAKNAESLRILNQKMKDRELHKFYLCLLINKPKKDNAILSDYLIKNEKTNKVTVLRNEKQGAKKILTKYSVLETNNNLTLCEVELLTGRTHQIRAHMSSIGCPILGDNKYGNKKLNQKYSLSKQCLYSYKLAFDFTTDSGILSYLDKKDFSTNDIWFMDYLK